MTAPSASTTTAQLTRRRFSRFSSAESIVLVSFVATASRKPKSWVSSRTLSLICARRMSIS